MKYLGIDFYIRLTWKAHVDTVVEKCNRRVNLLNGLSETKWGASKEALLIVCIG